MNQIKLKVTDININFVNVVRRSGLFIVLT